ncbi:MAG: hypothetical protein M1812_005345 [Candelaria pacifica]|nr:MAG: hypothetical protein M1812_005345 [Candelaria pacifica]
MVLRTFAYTSVHLADTTFNQFPSFTNHKSKAAANVDLVIDTDHSDDGLDIFNSSGNMAGTGSPSPFIKDEPDDLSFNSHRFTTNPQGYSMPQQQVGSQFGPTQSGSIDPSELSVQTGQNGSFMQYPFGSQQNLSSSFNLGNAGIGDDELLDLCNLDDTQGDEFGFQPGQNGFSGHNDLHQEQDSIHSMYPTHTGSLSMGHQGPMNQIYSHTPDGGPIQSPFIQGNFNYDHFRQVQPQQNFGHAIETTSSYNAPRNHAVAGDIRSGSLDHTYIGGRPRSKMSQGMDRKDSNSRSPMTPKTPALGGLNLGTPESGSFPSQPIRTHHLGQHRHQKSLSNQWDSTPASAHSYVDSPISSPGQPSHHPQISEILKSGKHASLPAKVEAGHHGGPVPAFQTQEAKRRRRRESHNMVERRRRDNINERIQELSHLVPFHRLEDEKVKKHLVNNSPLSPTAGSHGISPPQATSLLAGGNGRRAAGNITTGIPMEEKDKAPNKGDILNGAVAWTRDLMWALHVKIQQESELAEIITSLGGTFPYEQTEEDKRMRTEILDAIAKNNPESFAYSRGPGSGLRVPKHTNVAGEPVGNTLSPQSMSPANLSSTSGANSVGQGQQQFWSGQQSGGSGPGSISFKEEDEYGMDMT